MSKRWVISLAALLGLAGIAFIYLGLPRSDDSYEGEPLEFWLRAGQTWPPYLAKTNLTHEKAEEAVRHLGDRAIPVLLTKLRAADWPFKSRVVDLELRLHLIQTAPPPVTQSHAAGFEGFRILGVAGGPAVRELVQIVEADHSLSSRCYSIGALGYIGPAATNAIPFLLAWLTDTNATVRWNTALTLGRIHLQPEIVVPALVRRLDDGDPWVRHDAVKALGAFGPAARAATPALIRLSPDATLALEVSNALSQIETGHSGPAVVPISTATP